MKRKSWICRTCAKPFVFHRWSADGETCVRCDYTRREATAAARREMAAYQARRRAGKEPK